MDHYETSKQHDVIFMNTGFSGVIVVSWFDSNIRVWKKDFFFKLVNVMFRVYYHLTEDTLTLNISSSILPPDTNKFLFTLQIVDRNQLQYSNALFLNIESITNLPKSSNELAYDWRILVPFAHTCIKSFDIKKHLFNLHVTKV